MNALDWYFHLAVLIIIGFFAIIWSKESWLNVFYKCLLISLAVMALLLVLNDHGYVLVTHG